MDERTVYLYARHNGMDDDEAARFVDWFFDNRRMADELGEQPFDLTDALPVWNATADA